MSKKNDKISKRSQYDDYEEEERVHHKKAKVKKKVETGFDYLFEGENNNQKKKANSRYQNKKKDKNKYDRYDDWN